MYINTHAHTHIHTRSSVHPAAGLWATQPTQSPVQTCCIPWEPTPDIPTSCPDNNIHSQSPLTVKMLGFHKHAAVIIYLEH